ncbi:MAG: sigma D regulator [Gammaproteobacteria bacterium]|nr:sigma D regulator [Gammaproteobacteria bacterium]
MTTADQIRGERRQGSIKAIEQLIRHRTDMLSCYAELAAHRPFAYSEEMGELIQRFCQSLVDYCADAHFRLYRFIDTQSERRQAVAVHAHKIYPSIATSTQQILDFNDKYDTNEHCSQRLKDLERDLSTLGEILADRIEQEDSLVSILTKRRG